MIFQTHKRKRYWSVKMALIRESGRKGDNGISILNKTYLVLIFQDIQYQIHFISS